MPKKEKPIIETNPYLRDPKKLEEAIIWAVATSITIETGASPRSIARRLRKHRNRGRQIKRKSTPKTVKTQR